MEPGIDFANNPFFIYDMHKLCAVCNKKLEKERFSISEKLPKLNNIVTVLDALELLSEYNNKDGPENVCSVCYQNTLAAYKFRILCNKAHYKLTNFLKHQERMKCKVKKHAHIKSEQESLIPSISEDEILNNQSDKESMHKEDEIMDIEGEENTMMKVESEIEIEITEVIEEDVAEDTEEVVIEEVSNNCNSKVKNEKNSSSNQRNSISSKRTTCKVCHKTYRADYIQVHMRVHTGERPYLCTVCNKGFGTSTTLKLHEASHSEDRQFICRFCGNGYKLLRTLQIHERSHTGEKPFKCDQCELSFTSSSRRKQHQLVHTREKHYTCHLCAKSFTRLTILKDHLKSHAGVKNFACHMCGNRFTQAHSLRNHMQKSCRVQKAALDAASENTVEVYIYEPEEADLKEGDVV